MIRLLLDQGLPRSTISYLSSDEWDVIHVAAIGMATATDHEIITFASQQNRICVTLDADLHAILAVNQLSQPSVIRIRREGLKGKDVANLLNQTKEIIRTTISKGAIATYTEKNIRIRYLPIGK